MEVELLGAVLLGATLGANDAASVYGPAVTTRAVRYRTAIVSAAILVIVGAWTGGRRGMQTIGALGAQTPQSAFVITLAAALAMGLLLVLRLPASSSQALVGALTGAAVARGTPLDTETLGILVRGWVATPLVAALVALLGAGVLRAVLSAASPNLPTLDRWVRMGLFLFGGWGAYALGANNAANVTGVFAASGLLSPTRAVWIAGLSIAAGILAGGGRLMELVGQGLVRLEPPTALVAMLAQAITVHLFALFGMPVSASQALAGGVLGIGLGARCAHDPTPRRSPRRARLGDDADDGLGARLAPHPDSRTRTDRLRPRRAAPSASAS